jgi:hypothetical protein
MAMKRVLIGIFSLILIKIDISAQISDDEKTFGNIDFEYTQLFSELFEIVKSEFYPPITIDLIFVYDDYYGYGSHISPFTGKIYFYNSSYLQCDENTSIYSMTSGIVKNIIYDRMIIIEYNGIEIHYRDLNINNINIGDTISRGQLLGARRSVDALHNYFNGIMIKVKYKTFYFDIGYVFDIIKNIVNI